MEVQLLFLNFYARSDEIGLRTKTDFVFVVYFQVLAFMTAFILASNIAAYAALFYSYIFEVKSNWLSHAMLSNVLFFIPFKYWLFNSNFKFSSWYN